jgi:flagellin FlaB
MFEALREVGRRIQAGLERLRPAPALEPARVPVPVRVRDGEQGITGLETAIILIAFVVVAAVFAFVVLSTGLFSSERSKEAVYAGLAKTRGTMELSSGIIARSNGALTQVDSIEFDLVLAAAGDAVNLDPAATSNRTVITYIDQTTVVNDVAYTPTVLVGDADNLLEQGELIRLSISLAGAGAVVGPNFLFTLEIKPPTGSYLVVQRQTPPALAPIVQLN